MRAAALGAATLVALGAAPAAGQAPAARAGADAACAPAEASDRRRGCAARARAGGDRAARGPSLRVAKPDTAWRLAAPAWTAWAGGAVVFGHLLVLDPTVRHTALDARGPFAGDVAAFGRWMGDWEASLPVLTGGAVLLGLATEGPAGLRDVGALLGGIVAGSMANEAINQAVGRSRPLEEDGALSFDPFDGHASFPSGHAAFAFSIAGAVDAVTEGWAPAAAGYGVATVTGLSRIYDDKHWLTDVVVGAAVGTVVSRLAADRALRWMGGGRDDPADSAHPADPAAAAAGPAGAGRSVHVRPLVTARTLGVQLRF